MKTRNDLRLWCLAVLASGCAAPGATTAAPPGSGEGATLVATNPAVLRELGCVSTGPERCFDATDDNCNGIIDEGCGVETGAVQFAIAWEAAAADVDLLVTDPTGELAEVGRPLSSGLVKQRDCPGRNAECRGQNLENVYLEAPEAARGTYKVKIVLESLGGESPPVKIQFGARVGARSYGLGVSLDRPDAAYQASFSL